MQENDVRQRLRALTEDDRRRPETARLRDVFDDVEATLHKGFSQADVLAELHQAGFTMTMASFKSALQRIRKERATREGKPSKGTVAPDVPTASNHSPKKVTPRPGSGFIPRPADTDDESKLI